MQHFVNSFVNRTYSKLVPQAVKLALAIQDVEMERIEDVDCEAEKGRRTDSLARNAVANEQPIHPVGLRSLPIVGES